MRLQLVQVGVVVAFDGRGFERLVHALDLAVCPRMVGSGQPMFDAMLSTSLIEA